MRQKFRKFKGRLRNEFKFWHVEFFLDDVNNGLLLNTHFHYFVYYFATLLCRVKFKKSSFKRKFLIVLCQISLKIAGIFTKNNITTISSTNTHLSCRLCCTASLAHFRGLLFCFRLENHFGAEMNFLQEPWKVFCFKAISFPNKQKKTLCCYDQRLRMCSLLTIDRDILHPRMFRVQPTTTKFILASSHLLLLPSRVPVSPFRQGVRFDPPNFNFNFLIG